MTGGSVENVVGNLGATPVRSHSGTAAILKVLYHEFGLRVARRSSWHSLSRAGSGASYRLSINMTVPNAAVAPETAPPTTAEATGSGLMPYSG